MGAQYVSGPQDMKVTELDDPVPNPDQYTIAIHATACNFYDLLQIRGKYQHQPPLPWVSGSEFSGTIIATPSSPSPKQGGQWKYKKGDKVFGAAQGGYAEKVCALEQQLRPVPKGWDFFEAAVQIAKALGVTVVATAGTQHKLDVAKRFGADHLIDYRDESWPQKVKALTPKGRGVDIVYDPVGLIDKSTKCIAWNGRLLVVGFAGGPIEKVATNKMLLKNISVVGLHWGAYAQNEPERVVEVWDRLFELFESKKVRGTNFLDKEFVGLEKVPEALKALGERDTWGKVVVKVPQGGQAKL